MKTIGIYLHVPFCVQKCPYCDFYSLPYQETLAQAYTDAVIRAVRTQPFGAFYADTVYFGGGTPVLLGAKRIARILQALPVVSDAEVTVEVNPVAVMGQTLQDLYAAGVNRISFGVQSMQNQELAALGRMHSVQQAVDAIEAAHRAGFDRISADLMLAIPGQTRASLRDSVQKMTGLPIGHISAYLLKIEPDTPFERQKNVLTFPDEDDAAQLYLDCVEWLAEKGFAQYEVSNFSSSGQRSRHNLKYWRCEEYLGIGPAAHSFLDGRRFYFPRDLSSFIQAEQPFTCTVADGIGGSLEEIAMLRLRLTEGLCLTQLDISPHCAEAVLAKAQMLASHGLVQIKHTTIALTTQGFLLSNAVIAALLEAMPPERE